LRKLWIVIIATAIVGGAALVDFYGSLLYPRTKYEPEGLPPLAVGVEREYDFFKDGERVGRYVFWVERIGPYKGQTAYFTRSLTFVVYHETVIKLETVYIFNENLAPLEYRLNATLGEDRESITCFFDGWKVDASLRMADRTVENKFDLPADTVLIDTNMLGHWELFLKSFNLVPSSRVKFTMFVPQALDATPMELVIDKEKETLTLNGVNYECQLVRVPDLNLTFYIYNGDLLKLEESEQQIEVVAAPG